MTTQYASGRYRQSNPVYQVDEPLEEEPGQEFQPEVDSSQPTEVQDEAVVGENQQQPEGQSRAAKSEVMTLPNSNTMGLIALLVLLPIVCFLYLRHLNVPAESQPSVTPLMEHIRRWALKEPSTDLAQEQIMSLLGNAKSNLTELHASLTRLREHEQRVLADVRRSAEDKELQGFLDRWSEAKRLGASLDERLKEFAQNGQSLSGQLDHLRDQIPVTQTAIQTYEKLSKDLQTRLQQVLGLRQNLDHASKRVDLAMSNLTKYIQSNVDQTAELEKFRSDLVNARVLAEEQEQKIKQLDADTRSTKRQLEMARQQAAAPGPERVDTTSDRKRRDQINQQINQAEKSLLPGLDDQLRSERVRLQKLLAEEGLYKRSLDQLHKLNAIGKTVGGVREFIEREKQNMHQLKQQVEIVLQDSALQEPSVSELAEATSDVALRQLRAIQAKTTKDSHQNLETLSVMERELEKFEQDYAKDRTTDRSIEDVRRTLSDRLKSLQTDIVHAQAAVRDRESDISRARIQLEQLRSELAAVEQAILDAEHRTERAVQRVNDLTVQLKELQKGVDAAKVKHEKAVSRCVELAASVAKAVGSEADRVHVRNELESSVASAREEVAQAKRTLNEALSGANWDTREVENSFQHVMHQLSQAQNAQSAVDAAAHERVSLHAELVLLSDQLQKQLCKLDASGAAASQERAAHAPVPRPPRSAAKQQQQQQQQPQPAAENRSQ